uniref:Uncharacterized protein n=1 Tax=Salix viminalis TaxID=40686 RepID=A0A6N2NKC2_SALVM
MGDSCKRIDLLRKKQHGKRVETLNNDDILRVNDNTLRLNNGSKMNLIKSFAHIINFTGGHYTSRENIFNDEIG